MARGRGRRGYGSRFAPYVPVARRRGKAEKFAKAAERRGEPLQPVVSRLRGITSTFWGRAWCENLESYGDFANRLPRGRTYLRNGSVIDLRIERGQVDGWVSGSEIYQVEVEIAPLPQERWADVRAACSGKVESLVDLLEGRLSEAVMDVLTSHEEGIFPAPGEIELGCTCPDSAWVCKHVAAALYGIGVRFDADPTLFFSLRGVDHNDLLASVAQSELGDAAGRAADSSHIDEGDLASVFGIEMDEALPARTEEMDASRRTGTPPADRLTAKSLTAAGVPRSTISSWLRRGVLGRTATRGVYAMTDKTGPAMEVYFGNH